MKNFEVLLQNKEFLMNAYGFNGIMGVLLLVAVIDLGLKGWALWRAAHMNKRGWFIALLVINSMGILPTIFLLVTNGEYAKLSLSSGKNSLQKRGPKPSF